MGCYVTVDQLVKEADLYHKKKKLHFRYCTDIFQKENKVPAIILDLMIQHKCQERISSISK